MDRPRRGQRAGNMKNQINIRLDIIPPKATKKNGKAIMRAGDGRMFIGNPKNSTWKKAESELTALLMPYAPSKPMTGPLEVQTTWVWPHVSGTRTRDRGKMIPRSKKPDIDNHNAGLFDVMTSLGYWEDDAQVSQVISSKWNGPVSYLEIRVRPAAGY